MIKMAVVLLSISLGGFVGWWFGSRVGLMTGYFLAVIGSSAGLYLGRQYCRNYLD